MLPAVELREAVTLSQIFFPEWSFSRFYSISMSLNAVHGAAKTH